MMRNKRNFVVSAQELADILSCLNVCVWIRGEQLANPESVLRVPGGAEVDTHDLHVPVCRAQMEFGNRFYKQASTMLQAAGFPNKASWSDLINNGPKKN